MEGGIFPPPLYPPCPLLLYKSRTAATWKETMKPEMKILVYIEYTPPLDNPPHRNSSNDYMRVWKQTKHNLYLHELLERKASICICAICKKEATW
ncbi:uncharacterized protein LACBIDRAFT_312588 [Laccaria bicolor S238N-H82]|uniref:Predicted protein n=1 Tax=Laccaria bicolor (strain S238N-H82 / ATCC MYA-4686) TaxID=486041 RepID=B0DWG9_LACBS|nr:uncharacterized protein LACBIDRAFT_312588 [Laccaria bicolor S238N-H82]EDR01087.1 predicted protein [Laccaria bicolor S238N-H82]|eukprot:XP_001888306.1 predicted protein [Laccaria bicolor S238N-H82]